MMGRTDTGCAPRFAGWRQQSFDPFAWRHRLHFGKSRGVSDECVCSATRGLACRNSLSHKRRSKRTVEFEQDRDGNAMAWKHGMLRDGKMRRSTISRSSSRRAGVSMMQPADLGDGDDLAP